MKNTGHRFVTQKLDIVFRSITSCRRVMTNPVSILSQPHPFALTQLFPQDNLCRRKTFFPWTYSRFPWTLSFFPETVDSFYRYPLAFPWHTLSFPRYTLVAPPEKKPFLFPPIFLRHILVWKKADDFQLSSFESRPDGGWKIKRVTSDKEKKKKREKKKKEKRRKKKEKRMGGW